MIDLAILIFTAVKKYLIYLFVTLTLISAFHATYAQINTSPSINLIQLDFDDKELDFELYLPTSSKPIPYIRKASPAVFNSYSSINTAFLTGVSNRSPPILLISI